MNNRFANLKKVPPQPAARLLAMANLKLDTELQAPVSAPVDVVLAELDAKAAFPDTLKLLSVALPPREAVWWACLAGRDLLAANPKLKPPRTLEAAEAWVFRPTEENRAAVQKSVDTAENDDDCVWCAMAAIYSAGNLGVGHMSEYPVAPEALPAMVIKMVISSLSVHAADFEDHCRLVVDRALDIARGGSGQITPQAQLQEGV